MSALFIPLSSLTCPGGSLNCITPTTGTQIDLVALGTICFMAGGTDCMSATGQVGGALDANNTELASSPSTQNFNRLPGSVNAGVSSITDSFLNVGGGSVSTNIPNDFFIPGGTGISLFIPSGAQFLVLGILDSVFQDNSGNVSVQVNEITAGVPEPATLGLLGAGLLGLAAFRRYRTR